MTAVQLLKLNIAIHESVGDPDSQEANLSWMPYKDFKIINKKITSKCLVGVIIWWHKLPIPYYLLKRNLCNIII